MIGMAFELQEVLLAESRSHDKILSVASPCVPLAPFGFAPISVALISPKLGSFEISFGLF